MDPAKHHLNKNRVITSDPETLIRLVDSVPRWHETPTVQSP